MKKVTLSDLIQQKLKGSIDLAKKQEKSEKVSSEVEADPDKINIDFKYDVFKEKELETEFSEFKQLDNTLNKTNGYSKHDNLKCKYLSNDLNAELSSVQLTKNGSSQKDEKVLERYSHNKDKDPILFDSIDEMIKQRNQSLQNEPDNLDVQAVSPFQKYTKRKRKQVKPAFCVSSITSFTCLEKNCKICNLEFLMPEDWRTFLSSEFKKRYFEQIKNALHISKNFFPNINQVFYFTNLTRLEDVKVVILGQDPYFTPGKAMGLAFSVPKGFKIPPSLRVIYEEIAAEYENFSIPSHGDLSSWAKQGVLLLNNILTVTDSSPLAHSKIGWDIFTSEIVSRISKHFKNVVFMLWGSVAKSKSKFIDRSVHLVLEADHPNSFVLKSFKQCQHFKICNKYLIDYNKMPINWSITDSD